MIYYQPEFGGMSGDKAFVLTFLNKVGLINKLHYILILFFT